MSSWGIREDRDAAYLPEKSSWDSHEVQVDCTTLEWGYVNISILAPSTTWPVIRA